MTGFRRTLALAAFASGLFAAAGAAQAERTIVAQGYQTTQPYAQGRCVVQQKRVFIYGYGWMLREIKTCK